MRRRTDTRKKRECVKKNGLRVNDFEGGKDVRNEERKNCWLHAHNGDMLINHTNTFTPTCRSENETAV